MSLADLHSNYLKLQSLYYDVIDAAKRLVSLTPKSPFDLHVAAETELEDATSIMIKAEKDFAASLPVCPRCEESPEYRPGINSFLIKHTNIFHDCTKLSGSPQIWFDLDSWINECAKNTPCVQCGTNPAYNYTMPSIELRCPCRRSSYPGTEWLELNKKE